MCQSLIRSHANGPDPKDVARVGMMMATAEQTHGPQRNRPMNGASMRPAVWRLQPKLLLDDLEGRGYLRSWSHVNKFTML